MSDWMIVALVCLSAVFVIGATALARTGFSWVKAGFDIGIAKFYVEAGGRQEMREKYKESHGGE